jgi:hypothetical protein
MADMLRLQENALTSKDPLSKQNRSFAIQVRTISREISEEWLRL